MNNYYIINDFLQFSPLSNRLTKLNEKNVYVTLNSPASRCLLMLIKQQGNIITQQEFMDEVWQKKGMVVGKNTYYQNISILRKTFKNIGMDEDIVITIPRIGLTLAQGVDIRFVPAEENKSLLKSSKKTSRQKKAFRIYIRHGIAYRNFPLNLPKYCCLSITAVTSKLSQTHQQNV